MGVTKVHKVLKVMSHDQSNFCYEKNYVINVISFVDASKDCIFWTYAGNTKKCWIKHRIGNAIHLDGDFSGPKFCGK